MNPKDAVGKTKPPIGLIPGAALVECSMVAALGSEKYGPFNWRTQPIEVMEYAHAALRHLLAFIDGEDADPESGRHHLAHVMQTAAIVLDATSIGSVIDNRPSHGTTAERIREATRVPAVTSHDTTNLYDDFGAVLANRKSPAGESKGPVVGRVRRGQQDHPDR